MRFTGLMLAQGMPSVKFIVKQQRPWDPVIASMSARDSQRAGW
jgi:hypothetical protein